MKIAIIGAGFTGLTAAWKLSQHNHQVTLFEVSDSLGGLAGGLSNSNWEWTLEHHYHHIFSSDIHIINLAKETNFSDQIIFTPSKTSVLYQDQLYPFDNPKSLISFPHLSPLSKIRTSITLAFLKFTPTWQYLEKITAESFIKRLMGKQAWHILWQSLFTGKFGKYSSQINAAWFWARIKVRSKKLGYFEKGFQHFANHLGQTLSNQGVRINSATKVQSITPASNKVIIESLHHSTKKSDSFDRALVTTPSSTFLHLVKSLPRSYIADQTKLKGLAALTLILELNQPFFQDHTYWLNINQPKWPFLAVVEHTNFMPSKHYGHKHLVYIGRYLSPTDANLKKSTQQLLSEYKPYLTKLNPQFETHINQSWVFTAPFAQPITPIHHSQFVPDITTPAQNIYWASMQHIYPYDRGINYAVKLGNQAAEIIMHE